MTAYQKTNPLAGPIIGPKTGQETAHESSPQDLWVFGYGSLMWRPGFPFVEARPADLVGYRRSFCIYSTHHRGNHLRPGLVLGLDQGGTCAGMAFRVPATERAATMAYLREREQINGVYRECWVPVSLHDGDRDVLAVTYVVERFHPSYSGRLPFHHQVRLIRAAHGISGANVDYLVNTGCHLAELGLRDRHMERLISEIGGFFMQHSSLLSSQESESRQPSQASRPNQSGPSSSTGRSKVLVTSCRLHPPSAPRMRAHERRRFLYRIQLDTTRD